MHMTEITSSQNPNFKMWRKLTLSRKQRYAKRQLLIEGEHLLGEARASDCRFHAFLCEAGVQVPDTWRNWLEQKTIPTYVLRTQLFRDLTDTDTPQGIAAVIDMPPTTPFRMGGESSLVLLVDRIQDPGNLGTILRTADAAGVSFVGLQSGTVDPFNPKVVRAAMGALFRLPLQIIDLKEWMADFRYAGGFVVGTDVRGGQPYYEVTYPNQVAFLIGNEGQGVAHERLGKTDVNVHIPLPGQAESLNVSAASAVLLYEVIRQRSV